MATLEKIKSQRKAILTTHSTVGRAPSCTVQIPDAEVSSTHASIEWANCVWTIRDLNSKNGTFLDGSRLVSNERKALAVDSRVDFGIVREGWHVRDLSPPLTGFLSVDDGNRFIEPEHGTILVPGSDPLVTVYQGEDGKWSLENAGVKETLYDGYQLHLHSGAWRFSCPESSMAGTVRATNDLHLNQTPMRFDVSADEERVEITLEPPGISPVRLEAKSSFYLLLLLARTRLAHPAPAAEEAGWLDCGELSEMLRMNIQHLNIDVFRARRYFAAAGVVNAIDIVMRRPGTGQMRIGTADIDIIVCAPGR